MSAGIDDLGMRSARVMGLSLFTAPREDEELVGLVNSLTPHAAEEHLPWSKRPLTLGLVVLVLMLCPNILFW